METLDRIIASGTPFKFERSKILDWFDQPIVSLAKVHASGWVLQFLVAWESDERRGVRVYIPVDNQVVPRLLNDELSWSELKLVISEVVDSYVGTLLISSESRPNLSSGARIVEAHEVLGFAKACLDLDEIMNNSNLQKWIAFAEEQ